MRHYGVLKKLAGFCCCFFLMQQLQNKIECELFKTNVAETAYDFGLRIFKR